MMLVEDPPADPLAWKYKLSGIFGYINYLVEKDRKYILDTLVNGELRQSRVEGYMMLTT